MKKIGFLINQKEKAKKTVFSDKELFYLFGRVIRGEYGNQGVKNLKPIFFKNKKIFIKAENSSFANELLLNKSEIIKKINLDAGSEEVLDLKIN